MRNDYKVFQRNNSLEHMRGHMAQVGKRGRENGIHQMLSRHCGLIAGLSVVETEGNTRLFSAPTPSFFDTQFFLRKLPFSLTPWLLW